MTSEKVRQQVDEQIRKRVELWVLTPINIQAWEQVCGQIDEQFDKQVCIPINEQAVQLKNQVETTLKV